MTKNLRTESELRIEQFRRDFEAGRQIPVLSARVLEAERENRQWTPDDSAFATAYLTDKMVVLDTADMFEEGTESYKKCGEIMTELEDAENLLNERPRKGFHDRLCLLDEDGFDFLAASGYGPYLEHEGSYEFPEYPETTALALQDGNRLRYPEGRNIPAVYTNKSVRNDLAVYHGQQVPVVMGNPDNSLKNRMGFGVSFQEYCDTHSPAVYDKVLAAPHQAPYGKILQNDYNRSFYRKGYEDAAVNTFDMLEAEGKRMGIDTTEPIEFMNAAMEGFCERMRQRRIEGKQADPEILRKMNQCLQTVNLYLIEYYGSRGLDTVYQDAGTRGAFQHCLNESSNYYLQDGHIKDDALRKERSHLKPVFSQEGELTGNGLAYDVYHVNERTRAMLQEGFGYRDVYPMRDVFPNPSEQNKLQTGARVVVAGDFIPMDRNGKGRCSRTFGENQVKAVELAQEKFPRLEAKEKLPTSGLYGLPKNSEVSKALANANALMQKSFMESQASVSMGMDF